MTNKLHSLYTVALIDVLKILTLSLIAHNKYLTTTNIITAIFFAYLYDVSVLVSFYVFLRMKATLWAQRF